MTTRNHSTRGDFTIPALLLALSIVPTLGGAARLMSVARDTHVTPDNARFLDAPVSLGLHLLAATVFCLLGAFQFSAGLRRRWPAWHRAAGRVLVACGLLAGATGLWMTATYDIPVHLQGPLTYATRLVVGTAMVASLLAAWVTILRGQVARHEAFMIRAYALGQGAGTQALLLGPWMLLTGETGGPTRDVLMALSWVLNAAIAEVIVAARARARVRAAASRPDRPAPALAPATSTRVTAPATSSGVTTVATARSAARAATAATAAPPAP